MSEDPRDALAEWLGIVSEYHDLSGALQRLGTESRNAILAAMGAPTDADGAAERLSALRAAEARRPVPLWSVVEAEAVARLEGLEGRSWRLVPEDGTPREGKGPDLGVLPLGIHALEVADETVWLLAAPAHLPEPALGWGVTLPLYGLAEDGRIGSYADLAAAVEGLGGAGAGFVGVNPVHAGFPTAPDAISPYAPSHRGRFSVMHVAPVEEPGIAPGDLLDYTEALPARMRALRAEWEAGTPPDAFREWRRAQGADLERFALHQALAERFGPYWPDWPDPYRDPTSSEVRDFADEADERVTFHAWLQWRAETQLAEVQGAAERAGMPWGLYLDLAVGTHPKGAETWGAADLFARGVSLGAPPDAFSSEGQSWGLAPLRPDTLAATGFRALAETLGRQLRFARLLRIDHILGFERAFWVPDGGQVPGAYVRMPRAALLAVARIEAHRAGAAVIGEDLGNIPDGLRDALAGSGVLGCRVAQFEQHWEADETSFKPSRDYAAQALTSFSTHDLPTWEGWKEGRDIAWRHDLGSIDAEQRDEAMARRSAERAALLAMLDGEGPEAIHAFLAATPSRLIAVQIEDILGRLEQPNLPGTVHDHPNWRRRLCVAPDTLGGLDAVTRTAALMRNTGRQDR